MAARQMNDCPLMPVCWVVVSDTIYMRNVLACSEDAHELNGTNVAAHRQTNTRQFSGIAEQQMTVRAVCAQRARWVELKR